MTDASFDQDWSESVDTSNLNKCQAQLKKVKPKQIKDHKSEEQLIVLLDELENYRPMQHKKEGKKFTQLIQKISHLTALDQKQIVKFYFDVFRNEAKKLGTYRQRIQDYHLLNEITQEMNLLDLVMQEAKNILLNNFDTGKDAQEMQSDVLKQDNLQHPPIGQNSEAKAHKETHVELIDEDSELIMVLKTEYTSTCMKVFEIGYDQIYSFPGDNLFGQRAESTDLPTSACTYDTLIAPQEGTQSKEKANELDINMYIL
ncbi:hypothetical protein FGO68_gene2668 [Halteria grandinella]|uniref:Uncharacterized protein n=1 Tax=Halteria grandinella TaxID=5974 RepID=A0A8J8NNP1_HALGN|nr:hypothetical protein FGO68_gene2668 [Halteria grandinella]